MVRMQWVVCPACGRGHTFSMRADEATARAYGYTCPETGGPAAIGPRGQWPASEYPSQGAVVLTPLGVAAKAPADWTLGRTAPGAAVHTETPQ